MKPLPEPLPTEPARQRRGLDVELQTMARIDRLLADLRNPQVRRVLTWLVEKYGEADEEKAKEAAP